MQNERVFHGRLRDVETWRRLVARTPEVHHERYWPAYVALAVGIVLQVRLPAAYSLGPTWVLPVIEAALLAAVAGGRYLSPSRRDPVTMRAIHLLTLGLIAVVSVDNLTALGLLVRELLRGLETDGRTLVLSALAIWLTNVIVFALWFWELDGGGPVPRRADLEGPRDFLFPQAQLRHDDSDRQGVDWSPDFVDYFYVSYTNATAFSPTDTMPLSQWAKLLMTVQSAAALLTVALIAARAVNILK